MVDMCRLVGGVAVEVLSFMDLEAKSRVIERDDVHHEVVFRGLAASHGKMAVKIVVDSGDRFALRTAGRGRREMVARQ